MFASIFLGCFVSLTLELVFLGRGEDCYVHYFFFKFQ